MLCRVCAVNSSLVQRGRAGEGQAYLLLCWARRPPLWLPAAGLNHEWSLEKYGELLEIGGGKERMDHYFQARAGF